MMFMMKSEIRFFFLCSSNWTALVGIAESWGLKKKNYLNTMKLEQQLVTGLLFDGGKSFELFKDLVFSCKIS